MTLSNPLLEWLPLVDAVIKASMILAIAACASFVLRRASAAARHLVWTLALCSAIVLPVLTVVLPKWQLPIVTIVSEHAVRAEATAPAPDFPAAPALSRTGTQADTNEAAPAVAEPRATVAARVWRSMPAMTWQETLLGIWLAGAALIALRLAIGFLAVGWFSRRTHEITDASWIPMARSLAAEMGVCSRLRFVRRARTTMPVAAGIFRPTVIMPADADAWSENRLRIVLLHELAHVKRRDCLTHLVAQVACAFYWFNPLAWMAAKRARTERERACDDLVLAAGTRSSEYADQLLEIARSMRGHRFAGLMNGASLAMAHRSQLEGRLIAILDPKLPRAGVSRRVAAAAVFLCCCAVAPLGALQPWTASAGDMTAVKANADVPLHSRTDVESAGASNAAQAFPAANERGGSVVHHPQQPQPPQHAQQPLLSQPAPPAAHPSPSQPSQPRNPRQPAVSVDDITGPIAQAAVDGVAGALERVVEKALEGAPQDPKPEPNPKPRSGSGSGRQADPRMIAALTAALKDTDKEVRETAMQALVQMRDPSVFEPLVQALKDASPDVREQAAAGLGQMRDRRAVEPLTAALRDQNASVREQAAFALGQLGDRSAVAGLTIALKDSSASVREQAAFALGQLRDPAAVEGLSLAVRDANPSVREQAVFALSQIRDKRAIEPLISALKDSSAEVRKQAAFALGQLRDRSAVEALIVAAKDTSGEVREQVIFALGQLRDPRAIDALTTALKDQSAEVRQQAAFALGQLAR